MNLFTFAVVSLCVGGVYGMSPCSTPTGSSGECISLTQCEPLLALVNNPKKTKEDIILLQNSTCGSLESVSFVPKVCCPKKSEPEPVYAVNGPCVTPDGKPGKCVSIYSCPDIANMLRPPISQEILKFVRSSECKSSVKYSVCCGPRPEAVQKEPSVKYSPVSGSCETQTAFPPDPSSGCCGEMASVGNKIVGVDSKVTLIDEHPWVALIEYSKFDGTTGLQCGGSLISGKYVLTAAHCITGRILQTSRPKRVRLGEFDTLNEGADCVEAAGGGEDCTDGAMTFDIEKTIPHPKYQVPSAKINDIGLIRLKETAPFTDFIRPICLPVKDLTQPGHTPPNFSMSAVGWGINNEGVPSNVKIQVSLPFVSMDKCQPEYSISGRTVNLWRGQICAGGSSGDACNGDSGGPLVYENQSRYELTGVVSFGLQNCGTIGVPGIYTNVYEYLDWIKSVIVA